MTVESRYGVVCELFEAACVLHGEKRRAFLRERCAGDEELAKDVLELLEYDAHHTGAIPADSPDPGSAAPSSRLIERLSAHSPREPRHRLEGEIARGGMGAILEAWDEDLRRKLAMKVMLKQVSPGSGGETPEVSQRALVRFIEEAQITGQLEHPGIVPVHELGIDDRGRIFFTMRLVQGRDLREVLRLVHDGDPSWSLTRVLGLLLKACEAVAFAHSRGVIHRDLKPANVMVGSFGEVYVMDWGLGRVLESPAQQGAAAPVGRVHTLREESAEPGSSWLTREGDVAGTPYYMSPEQASGSLARMGPQSDVYSLGAMLYELLSGRRPYGGTDRPLTPYAALAAIRAGPPESLSEVAPEVPAELAAICDRAMVREPGGRYADVGELAADLQAYLEHRVVRAYRTGAWVEFRKWIERNRATAGALAALMLAVCAIGFLLAWGQRAARLRTDRALEEFTAGRLVDEAQALWPSGPGGFAAVESWLREARELTLRLPARRAELAAFDARHLRAQRAPDEAAGSGGVDAFELPNLEGRRANFEEKAAGLRSSDGAEDRRALDVYLLELELLEQEIERLTVDRSRREAPRPADELLARRREKLARLVSALEDLERPGSGWIARISERLEVARHSTGIAFDEEWRGTIEAIARSPAYGGLRPTRQADLVPLGENVASGLWEFWHTPSGERPRAGADGGWIVEPRTGVVLVLLPGGDFHLGAQSAEPDAPNHCDLSLYPFIEALSRNEQPVHPVSIDPYFISRYELTQGQWLRATGQFSSSTRFAGAWYSGQPVISRTHPIESADWGEAQAALRSWGLTLPTEAQWAFAARGGGDEIFGATADVGDMRGAANIYETDQVLLADDYLLHAPVDSFTPNPYGLHHVFGNVSEWCLDWFVELDCYDDWTLRPGTGELLPITSTKKAVRGAAYNSPPEHLRVSRRIGNSPSDPTPSIGIRPARVLGFRAP